MRAVRVSLEQPDEITASATSARENIGRAIAEKIRETPPELLKKLAEDVLPEVEKFLESPEERRLRRVRSGVITSMVGAGASLLMFMLWIAVRDVPPDTINLIISGVGAGIVTFLIGMGIIINAFFFTLSRKQLPVAATDTADLLDAPRATPLALRDATTAAPLPVVSVTEHTTQHLANKSQR
jgi:hypothetical protein